MWTLVAAFTVAGLVAAWGCGDAGDRVVLATDEPEEEPVLTEEQETVALEEPEWPEPVDVGALSNIGQLELSFSAPTTPGFQLGAQTSGKKLRCNKTSTGQSCSVLTHKNPVYCYHSSTGLPNGFGGTRPGQIQAIINGFDDAAGWTWTAAEQDVLDGSCLEFPHSIQILNTTNGCGASGTASEDIADYGCAVFSGGNANLVEGMGVVGTYRSHSGCSVRVDTADIEAKYTNATSRDRAFKHAVGHGLDACVGIGGRNTVELVTSRTVMNVAGEKAVLSAGERCAIEAFNVSNTTQFNNSGTCPSE